MKNKIYFLATLIVITILSPLAISAVPAGAIIDGSFENWTGNTLDDWIFDSPNGILTKSTGRLGGFCANITGSDSEFHLLEQGLGGAFVGADITVSVYLNVNYSIYITIYVKWYNGGSLLDTHTDESLVLSEDLNEWVQYVGTTATAPATTNNFVLTLRASAVTKLLVEGAGVSAPAANYIALFDDCTATGSAISEMNAPILVILSTSFIITAGVINKRSKQK